MTAVAKIRIQRGRRRGRIRDRAQEAAVVFIGIGLLHIAWRVIEWATRI